MQERRIFKYLSEDDIPSSAATATVGATFNVAYIPISDIAASGITTNRVSEDTSVEIDGFDTSRIQTGNLICRANDGYFSSNANSFNVMYPKLSGGNYTYSSFEFVPNYKNAAMNGGVRFLPVGCLGYIKLTFSNTMTVKEVRDSEYSTYIDTENERLN